MTPRLVPGWLWQRLLPWKVLLTVYEFLGVTNIPPLKNLRQSDLGCTQKSDYMLQIWNLQPISFSAAVVLYRVTANLRKMEENFPNKCLMGAIAIRIHYGWTRRDGSSTMWAEKSHFWTPIPPVRVSQFSDTPPSFPVAWVRFLRILFAFKFMRWSPKYQKKHGIRSE